MQIRTRFAPSPTGFLHIGGARTALYSWLYARHRHGKFILRIEDTDVERSTQESADAILHAMDWLDLDYDEGPYYQSQRLERYREVVEVLLAENKAYRCNCTKERLEILRAEQLAKKQKPRYDGHCRDLNLKHTKEPYVIRFRNPHEGEVSFTDEVFGHMVFQISELDDLVLVRSDGIPTYNFSVVVDDYDMQITHVIRGDDHLNNTPRQINIFKALGAPIPAYAHLPMILGADGKRFSKRHGAVSVLQYRDDGYLPDALLNYLIRLGWSHGDQEIFSRDEMIILFDFPNIHKSPAAFNPEKLLWLNQHYIKTMNLDELAQYLGMQLQQMGINYQNGPELLEVARVQRDRAKTLKELAEKSVFFFSEVKTFDKDASKQLTPDNLSLLQQIHEKFSQLQMWNAAEIHRTIEEIAEYAGLKLGKVAQPIRAAVTGGTISPSIDVTLELLGKSETLKRLQYAIHFVETGANQA